MGCCSSKQIINGVNLNVQVNKSASKNLPAEVITGTDKVLSLSDSSVSVVTFHKLPTKSIDRLISEETQGLGSKENFPIVDKTEVSVLDQTSKDEKEKTKFGDFHLSLAPKDIVLQQKKVLSDSVKLSTTPLLSEATNGEQPMLNVLYEEPVTDPFLEMLKTQREGKQALAELWEPASEDQAPNVPKIAFMGEMEERCQELSRISV